MKDLYDSLGVGRDASADDIKKSYRQLTKKYHPDRNPGDKAAEERFKVASSAYEVLSDPDRRKLYDEFGEASLTQGFDAERARAYRRAQSRYSGFSGGDGNIFEDLGEARATSFDDLLSRLFGGARVRSGGVDLGVRPGVDVTGEITVGFVDALRGITVPLRIDGHDGSRTLDVKVPAGMVDGGKLRLRGQGGPGQPPGDVLLTVHVQTHPSIERDGETLRMSLPVTALEAYRGGPVDVTTPWGVVTVKLAPGSQNGQTLRLRGYGVRPGRGTAGDLLVTLDVRLPKAGDERLLEVLAALQTGENPRVGIEF